MKVIITGATGMVGEGVTQVCISHPAVTEILLISRRSSGICHPKVKELLHPDFNNIQPIAHHLRGYDACFYCMGVSSVGMDSKKYLNVTYTVTMHIAGVLSEQNKNMVFCYVSGAGTSTSGNALQQWARIKGRTENDLMRLPFKEVFNFRPALIKPIKGLKRTLKFYHYIGWLFPLLKFISPSYICTLQEVAAAMINVASKGYHSTILEVKDIKKAAQSI